MMDSGIYETPSGAKRLASAADSVHVSQGYCTPGLRLATTGVGHSRFVA